VTDISFDDNGKVSATRFRFAHTPVHYQSDFIDDLVLTRRATDQFSDKLTVLENTKDNGAPTVFTYSLFYVFYDQYTYIRGVLAQNALLGVAAVFLAL
jgi:Niemann-Pick C1 protein